MKARLRVQGCAETPGMDYDQKFCATMRPTSLRALASIAAGNGMRMRRWDFVAAYFKGKLQDGRSCTVMFRPDTSLYVNLGSDGRPRICRVEKPVYTEWRKPVARQHTLFPWLLQYDFAQSSSDPCIFTLRTNNAQIILDRYVDNLFILHSDDAPDSL
eukprot:6205329-Pleurochrysis_carterae.AAC.3